eukprot:TRINITY_DN2790_c0_g1_i16.p3 TRINITY_DN2790_c0_g1~~TRINITY_DN2790_c0_g1_i16.p3  ORF type:complete len:137 (-),score=58.48 TRINITY_DN2790_c0_g1_i16:127-537(-)
MSEPEKDSKKICKIKRSISFLLIKGKEYEEALKEFADVEVMEKVNYGDDSVKVGKTYKAMGTIYCLMDNYENAKEYLARAYKIFEAKGMEKQMSEVSAKLKSMSSPRTGLKLELIPSDSVAKPLKGKKKAKKKTIK